MSFIGAEYHVIFALKSMQSSIFPQYGEKLRLWGNLKPCIDFNVKCKYYVIFCLNERHWKKWNFKPLSCIVALWDQRNVIHLGEGGQAVRTTRFVQSLLCGRVFTAWPPTPKAYPISSSMSCNQSITLNDAPIGAKSSNTATKQVANYSSIPNTTTKL